MVFILYYYLWTSKNFNETVLIQSKRIFLLFCILFVFLKILLSHNIRIFYLTIPTNVSVFLYVF